jgi:hypothetical protein
LDVQPKNGDSPGSLIRADVAAAAALTLPNLGQKSGISTSATSRNIPTHETSKNQSFSGLIFGPNRFGGGDPGAFELDDGGFNRKISWNISDIDTLQGFVLSDVLSRAIMLCKYLVISTAEGVGFEPTVTD